MNHDSLAHVLWHTLSGHAALDKLASRASGLSAAEAEDRRRTFGPNTLPKPKRPGLWALYLRQFTSPLIYLLLAAAAVSMAIGEMTDALFIFAVLQINAFVGTVQEWRAESSAQSLDAMIRNPVTVVRDGHPHRLDGSDLVPGDVVTLDSGTRVPADLRLLAAHDLMADESLLTGESLPVAKDSGAVLPERCAVGDRANMLHAGTVVDSGRATGLVCRVGLHTELGRIAQALAATRQAPAPLVVRLERFTRTVGALVVGAVVVLAVVQALQGAAWTDIFLVSVALAVSAVPEGLPVAITVALSVSSARMARRNVIVRSLPAVEGLGACTLIASDKTGTLTCNELTARRLLLPDGTRADVGGEGYHAQGALSVDGAPADGRALAALSRLATAGALCNEAVLHESGDSSRHFGDTVDLAFLILAAKMLLHRPALLERFPAAGFVPYEPARRFAAAFNRDGDGIVASVKGAAETVLPMCDGIDHGAQMARATDLAAQGYRVLAVAAGEVDPAAARDMAARTDGAGLVGLEFLGFVGLIDPLRPEVPDAVARCRASGIGVRMVTGDHPATALAIARDLGIASDDAHVITGAQMAELADDPAALAEAMATARVFARVEPTEKLSIVQATRQAGHFVAVTGDGVNDAPALRAANIGVAMGLEGTDVARGAADLILTDDNFSSIVAGVEEGRIAYDNVRKVVYLLISTGASEIVLFMLALMTGLPLPLFAAQLLWLNLVTNGVQHVGLALEKGEGDVLARAPAAVHPIFDRMMIEQTVLSGAFIGIVAYLYFHWALATGTDEFTARAALLMLMVLFENAHVFNCRSEVRSVTKVPLGTNRFLLIAVVLAQSVHIGAAHVPWLADILRIAPMDLNTWLTLAPLALALVGVMEVFKAIRYPGGRRPDAV